MSRVDGSNGIIASHSDTRRRLGSYYTPTLLVNHLVRAAFAPLLAGLRRAASGEPRLPRLLDPAMGEGVFLKAAADLIAGTLARAACRPVAQMRPMVVARCLHGVDIDPGVFGPARRVLEDGAGEAVLVHGDFLAGRPPVDGPFDLILGNPPWGGWNRALGRQAKLDLRARFVTARGLIDPFALFLERCTGLLEQGGRLAMVLPDCFLHKNYPAARRLVLENYRIEELTHWGRAFPGVNLDACTLVAARRDTPGRRVVIRCLPDGPGGRVVRVPQSQFTAAPGHAFNLSLDSRDAALLERLETEWPSVGSLLETHEGIHTGNIRKKLFIAPGARHARGRPLLFGRGEIRPFRLRPEGWSVVYDADVIDRPRGEYANLGREAWFTSPKILVRRTGDVVMAALDRDGLYASNNLFVALPRPGCPVPLEYLEAFLNTSLATWCFRAIQPRVGRLFAELKLVHLNRLPVPVPRGPGGRREMDRIVGLAESIRRGPGDGRAARKALDESFARLAGLSTAAAKRVAGKSFRKCPPCL